MTGVRPSFAPAGLRGLGSALGLLALVSALTVAQGTGGLSFPRQSSIAAPAVSSPVSAQTKDRVADSYARLPLSFVSNRGQTAERVRYYAQGSGYAFFFTHDKAVLSFAEGSKGTALEMRFLGANPDAQLHADGRTEGEVNYMNGSEQHTGLPTYGWVTYRELWPGIDMAFRGQGGKLKYEFHVAAGADPSRIRLAYGGADAVTLGAAGNLLIATPLGTLRDSRPRSYQRVDGQRVALESRYALSEGASAYGFALAAHDPRRPLVIDPGLDYSTFLGGSGLDQGNEIAVDASGSAYVTGQVRSTNFPTTAGAFDTTYNGGNDAFVTKLNPAGSALVYSTYLGGSTSAECGPFAFCGSDTGSGIAVDASGSAFVTGQTRSSDFPTTAGAFDPTYNGGGDAFVTKLSPAGSALSYSTYLGGSPTHVEGSGSDAGQGIAVDASGSAYVTGVTYTADFPTTAPAYDSTYNGGGDPFVTKLNPAGSALAYSAYLGGSTYLGNSGFDDGRGIALDASGSAYVTGTTASADYPTTAGAFDPSGYAFFGLTEAFVTKLNPAGSALIYSTYLGGQSGHDQGEGIAVDASGSAYVTGQIDNTTTDFPTTAGAFDTSHNGLTEAFVTKLNPAGSALTYSTYLGDSGTDVGLGIAVDASGSAYVTGRTGSTRFPTTPGAFDTSFNGSFSDSFATKLNPAGSALNYSTYLGGSGSDVGHGIALDASGNAYVTGSTDSPDFPTTAGAFDTSANGDDDAFVTKLVPVGDPAMLTLAPPTATNTVGEQHCVTASVTDAVGNPVPDVVVRFTVTVANTASGQGTTDANGQAGFCYTGANTGTDTITAFADTDGDTTQDTGEPSGTATKTWTPAPLPALDHFKTYAISKGTPKFSKRTVTLADAFGTSQVSVNQPVWLANPVDKNGEGIDSPDAHLKCYSISDKKRFREQKLRIDNQFGTRQRLQIEDPKRLCVPASKGLANQTPPPPPSGLDHYKCYVAEGGKVNRVVTLTDQFVTGDQVAVRDPEYFCNPTNKNNEGITRPNDLLVCYELSKLDKISKRKVSLRDQFLTQTVEVKSPKRLCVPSTKTVRP